MLVLIVVTSFLDLKFSLSTLNGIFVCVIDQLPIKKNCQSNLKSDSKSGFLNFNSVNSYTLIINRVLVYIHSFNDKISHFVRSTIEAPESKLNIPSYELSYLYLINFRRNNASAVTGRMNLSIIYITVNSNIYPGNTLYGNFLKANTKKSRIILPIKISSDPVAEKHSFIRSVKPKTSNGTGNIVIIDSHSSCINRTEIQGITFDQLGIVLFTNNKG